MLRRELYEKHLSFFEAGSREQERAIIAANRVGKTESAGGYEMCCHLTGDYPDWWPGKRFEKPIRAWAAGDTSQTVRDILQRKLLGPVDDMGSGLIPAHSIVATKKRAGNVPDLVETVTCRHISGGISQLGFKSYDQGRESFQGTEQDVIWLDEEPSLQVYTECLLRLMTTRGLMVLTFTPLRGRSEVVESFTRPSPEGHRKHVTYITWDDVPHLSKEDKDNMLRAMPPHQRDARAKGIPQLGSGAIYPINPEEVTCKDFEIPKHWPRVYAMDVGWNATAAVWGAWDREADVIYIYASYKRGHEEPAIHAQAIKSRGEWIPGCIDPASAGANQKDGTRLKYIYEDLGLDLTSADNSVEAGILAVWERMSSGRIQVFASLLPWFEEFERYHRDEKGKIVKEFDHLMDCTRYLVMSGLDVAKVKPMKGDNSKVGALMSDSGGAWMAV